MAGSAKIPSWLPNAITWSRVVVLVLLVYLVQQSWPGAATGAFFAILYGAISDFVDGYLARKYELVTNFGKILDALIDKVMTLGSFALLFFMGLLDMPFVPPWLIAIILILIAAREIGITLLRMVAAKRGVVLAAEKAGKKKTIWQITAICVLFGVPMFGQDFARWIGEWPPLTDWILLNGWLYFLYAAWLTIASGTTYLLKYLPLVRAARAA